MVSPIKGQKGFQKNPNGASVVFLESRIKHVTNRMPCDVCNCGYDDETRFELHHNDFDRTHNDESNYTWCCVSCHKKLHYAANRRKVFEKGLPTIAERIVSILPFGKETVYDIEMQAPAHNFISMSGLITSNSH
jgi:hypothetical protein